MTNVPHGMVLLAGLFAWGIYRRIRRNIGRQKLRPRRIIVSMVILSVLSAFILSTALIQPVLGLAFGAGVLAGAALALLGLRHTKFETTTEGHFYTPNTYIGLGLSVLFLGRMMYRFYVLQGLTAGATAPAAFQSPLTLLILGLTVGYYLAYYIGLFVHTHDRQPDPTP